MKSWRDEEGYLNISSTIQRFGITAKLLISGFTIDETHELAFTKDDLNNFSEKMFHINLLLFVGWLLLAAIFAALGPDHSFPY